MNVSKHLLELRNKSEAINDDIHTLIQVVCYTFSEEKPYKNSIFLQKSLFFSSFFHRIGVATPILWKKSYNAQLGLDSKKKRDSSKIC